MFKKKKKNVEREGEREVELQTHGKTYKKGRGGSKPTLGRTTPKKYARRSPPNKP